jgi:hypothetical protein
MNDVIEAEVVSQTQGEGDPQVEGQPQGPGLSINDIAAAVQIIDVASARGAIRGDELVPIGTIRERFMAFLNYAKEQGQIDSVPGEAPTPEAPAS